MNENHLESSRARSGSRSRVASPGGLTLAAAALVFALSHAAVADTIVVAPKGPAQMPILYVKGFNDDGASWARDTFYAPDPAPPTLHALAHSQLIISPARSPSRLLELAGMPNFGVQWWGAASGGIAPSTTNADNGFAFLQTPDELLAGVDWMNGTWTAQNRPVPTAVEVLMVNFVSAAFGSSINEVLGSIGLPESGLSDDIRARIALATALRLRNNYNDAGSLDDRAEDMVEMLRRERQPGGRLSKVRQVNIVTHSMGSLITRAALSKAAGRSVQDAEFVANTIYNAPPWGGSTLAYLVVQLYSGPVTIAFFDDPITRKTVQAFVDQKTGSLSARLISLFLLSSLAQLDMTTLDEQIGSVIPLGVLLDSLGALGMAVGGTPIDWNDLGTRTALTEVAAVVERAKPFLSALSGVPARPAADDNVPARGVTNLTQYPTSTFTKQWVLYGNKGIGSLLFPSNPVQIFNDPTIIADPNLMFAQPDDGVVAVGSAEILSVPNTFPEPMEIAGPFDASHGDLGNLSRLLVPEWLDRFLAPTTSLVLGGNVSALDTEGDVYLVDEDAIFDFSSSPVEHTITFPALPFTPTPSPIFIQNTAQRYEYRVVFFDGSLAQPGWSTHFPADPPIEFGDLRFDLSLPEVPIILEWRSVNEANGREMIRSARIGIVGTAPVVAQTLMTSSNPEEVYEPPSSSRVGMAVRGAVFDQLAALDPSQLPLLNLIRSAPEADYVISNAATKGLALVLDKRGSIEYVWDDASFTSPMRDDDVSSLFLAPLTLTEGPHVLYYQTIQVVLGVETRSPIQTLRVTVDDTPPDVTFLGVPNHPLGIVAGPASPLRFQIEDLHSNSGSGSVTLDPANPIVIGENQVFSFSETTLKSQFESTGTVGLLVDLPVTASDRVNNSTSQTFQVYYDVTPPDLGLAELVGALPTGSNAYRVFVPTVDLAVDLSDQGAGFAEAPTVAIGTPADTLNQPAGALALGAVSGHPSSYGTTLTLVNGINLVTVRAEDIAGNVSLLTLEVDFQEALFDQDPLVLLSPRLGPDACWDENNVPESCDLGTINAADSSYHGDVFVFASTGERFIAGDTNNKSDIFMNRDGELTRISVAADGTQADNDSTRPAISGDGRYAYFMSDATNLVSGTTGFNFFVKDLASGEIAVISRKSDGTPADMPGNLSVAPLAPTGNGRYVYFESRSTLHLSGISDTNIAPDIFMVDLDPDENGDYFDDNYTTVGISKSSPTSMGNSLSQKPDVTLDGRFLVFRTQATNIHPDLADNGTTADGLQMRFSGSAYDGSLDVTSPELVPINREAVFNGTSVTSTGIADIKIAPLDEDIVFSTRSNLTGANDTNSQSTGMDVYYVFKSSNPQNRLIVWTSKTPTNGNSSDTPTQSFRSLSIATNEPTIGFDGFKLGWVSRHSNLVPGDSNADFDLFRGINDGTVSTGFAVSNWVTSSLPSGASTLLGGHTGDGRSAWWASTQEYTTPYSPSGMANLYRRRIDPSVTTTMTFTVLGGGSIQRDLPGAATGNPDAYDYQDEDSLILDAIPDVGFAFAGWQGIDRDLSGATALVRAHSDREVIATFVATTPPTSATASISTLENTRSDGVAPTVIGDPDQTYTVSIVGPPTNGIASVEAGLLHYDPVPGFFGADSFTFQVENEYEQMLPVAATATVTVLAVNAPPTSSVLSLIAAGEIPGCIGNPIVMDATPGETFSYSLLTPPAKGSVTINGGDFVYTGSPGESGIDDFTFLVVDSAGGTVVGLASVDLAALVDTDGNGAADLPACMDLDNDDLADVYENNSGSFVSPTETGTDPANPDSDGDGVLDGVEVAQGTDPNVANPAPQVPTMPLQWPLLLALFATGWWGTRSRRA